MGRGPGDSSAQVGLMHSLDEIDRVVVGDELQGIGDALDQVVPA